MMFQIEILDPETGNFSDVFDAKSEKDAKRTATLTYDLESGTWSKPANQQHLSIDGFSVFQKFSGSAQVLMQRITE